MSTNRRLAAIMVADVVGYARLMEMDEAGTLAALKERQTSILEPIVTAHGGRIVKVMGDGVLVEFGSAVNAIEGALDLQRRMADANDGVPDARRILLRIGVNLGDVIGEGSDIYGEGVNIAARLEPLAEPGGICISRSIQEQIANKINATFTDMGDVNLKNIAQPVRAYQIHGIQRASPPPAPGSDKPAIAVLPFSNMSGDPDQGYFCDGITEDVITELSRWHQLNVLSRHSSFQYRDRGVDVKRIGRELGAQYVVEGSVRPLGQRLRVTVQLIDAASGNHVWAERYDRDRHEIFAIQDDVVQSIAGTLVGRMQAARAAVAKRKPPESLAAYECVLRGHALPWGDKESMAEARKLYERAIELDPGYALAHAELALSIYSEWANEGKGIEFLDRAFALAKRSAELDPNESYCVFILGHMHLYRRSYAAAEEYHRRAVEMNPNNPEHLADYGFTLMHCGRQDEAWDWLNRAKRVDPYFNPAWYWHQLGMLHYTAHRYDEAIAAYEQSPSQFDWLPAYIGACHAQLGRTDRARQLAAETLRRNPGCSINIVAQREPFKKQEDLDHLLDGLRKAGIPD